MNTQKIASGAADYFDDESATWSERYKTQHHFRTRLNILTQLISELAPGQSILDFGCGTGIASHALATRGHRVTGVDISPGMIATSHQTLSHAHIPENQFRLETIKPDGAGEYLSATYDGVVSMGVLEYADDPMALLRLLTARIRPGGFLIMSGPNRRSPLRRLERFVFNHPGPFRHIGPFRRLTSPASYMHHQKHQFEIAELSRLLAHCNMSLRSAFFHGGPSGLGRMENTSWLGMTMIVKFEKAAIE